MLTSDTFGTARQEPARLPVRVVVLGKGNIDRMMLQAVKEGGGLAIAVDAGEG